MGGSQIVLPTETPKTLLGAAGMCAEWPHSKLFRLLTGVGDNRQGPCCRFAPRSSFAPKPQKEAIGQTSVCVAIIRGRCIIQ